MTFQKILVRDVLSNLLLSIQLVPKNHIIKGSCKRAFLKTTTEYVVEVFF